MKKPKYLLFALLLIFVGITFSGCRGTGAVASSWPGITVNGETAYIAFNASIYTIDLTQQGNLKRTAPSNDKDLRGHTFFHPPVILDEETLLVGSYKNSLYKIDSSSGQTTEFFTHARNRWIATPLISDETIYAPNANGTLYALALDGTVKWEFETDAAIWATPVKDNGSLYLVSQDHTMYAVNARTGDQIWAIDLGAASVNSPALDENGILYIGTFGSKVFAIDSKTGESIWEIETQDYVWGSPVLGPDSTLFVTDLSANLYAIDTQAANILWQKQVDTDTSITGSPLLVGEALFVITRSGEISSYSLEGERLWNEEIGNEENPVEFHGTPVLAGEDLILVSAAGSDKLIYAFNTELETQWSFEPGN
ncbi:MAG: PQQ-like beta-propeller repeat protein [Anaerolineales bacterium]|nr:PQQ-like beta-propeller repeat protein [Anaerolineales bacterium]